MLTPQVVRRHIKNESALFVINHSGGKDSQAMYLYLTRELKIPSHLVYVVHAVLEGVDWEGSEQHIEATVNPEHEIIYTQARDKAGNPKTFIDMVLKRNADRPEDPSFPSPKYRQCTSDLKRTPINSVIWELCERTGIYTVISCIGIRAGESDARAAKNPWTINRRLTGKNRRGISRKVWEWYPLHIALLALREDALKRAQYCWEKHKAPMALYWKVIGVYSGHLARSLDDTPRQPRCNTGKRN